jgi:hypothetical protein
MGKCPRRNSQCRFRDRRTFSEKSHVPLREVTPHLSGSGVYLPPTSSRTWGDLRLYRGYVHLATEGKESQNPMLTSTARLLNSVCTFVDWPSTALIPTSICRCQAHGKT